MVSNTTELGVLLCLIPLAGGSILEPLFPLLQNKKLSSPLNFPPRVVEKLNGCERILFIGNPIRVRKWN